MAQEKNEEKTAMRNFLFTLFILLSFSVQAEGNSSAPSAAAAPSSTPVVKDSPEERAYKEKMMNIANQISAKINEIQNKQNEIDSEVYPTYIPPLQAEKDNLVRQLKTLEMQKEQLESQKKAKELQTQLKQGN
jgi:Skp family chaperone for outer membrane proteins